MVFIGYILGPDYGPILGDHRIYFGILWILDHLKDGHRVLIMEIIFPALLKSFPRIHVLWAYQKY